MDKKKILVIIIIALGLIGITLGVCASLKDKKNPSNPKVPTPDNDQKLVKEYVGYYGMNLKDSNGVEYTENLYLREDSTFLLDINSFGVVYHPTAGVYEIKDNEITLTETVRYGSDACHFTNDLSTYKVDIKDKNTLTLNLNDRVVDFTRNTGRAESDEMRNYYVTNPKDGEEVAGFDTHMDCTNK